MSSSDYRHKKTEEIRERKQKYINQTAKDKENRVDLKRLAIIQLTVIPGSKITHSVCWLVCLISPKGDNSNTLM